MITNPQIEKIFFLKVSQNFPCTTILTYNLKLSQLSQVSQVSQPNQLNQPSQLSLGHLGYLERLLLLFESKFFFKNCPTQPNMNFSAKHHYNFSTKCSNFHVRKSTWKEIVHYAFCIV